MRFARFLLSALALCLLAMGDHPRDLTVRFFAEANERDGAPFTTPVKLGNPPRDAFLQKVPIVHEKQIRAIYPYRAADGTWGCAFKLDANGRLALEVVSTDKRGTFLIGFIGAKKGSHRLPDLIIDRTVTDGIVNVPRGLTDLEVATLSHEFKVLGGVEVPKLKDELRKEEKRGWWPFGRKKQPAA